MHFSGGAQAAIGTAERVQPLELLERITLFADVCLFAVIILPGMAVFTAESVGATKRCRLNTRTSRRPIAG
jgi:hypothetical protein